MMVGLPFTLLDFLFPQLCVLCGRTLLGNRAGGEWSALALCGECLERLEPLGGRRCRVCSLPLISELELCTRCRAAKYPFRSNIALYEYGGTARELIRQYKFRNEHSLALLFSQRIAGMLQDHYPGLPVVPVPSRPRSVRRRGWDHVGSIAGRLARTYRVEILHLLRRDNGHAQKGLDFANRLTNLHGRIHWAPKLSEGGTIPRTVVLLDDVFTTGATASECTRILFGGGVEEVYVATLAVD